jgi:hypothetical protein
VTVAEDTRARQREADGDGPAAGGALERSIPTGAIASAGGLSREDRTFLLLRDELYGGSWDDVESDLRARLGGKPFIFKLASRIEEDLERIERLRGIEQAHGVDLRAVLRAMGLE